MSSFELEIWDDECDKVTFYSVRVEGSDTNETDKFFEKHNKIQELIGPVQELLSFVIDSIGDDHGAINDFFNRKEDEVFGLPPHGKVTVHSIGFHFPQFPLRLYALRPNNREDIVILFNGGKKSAQTNQDSSELHMKFLEAKSFAKKIEEALRDGSIEIDEESRRLVAFDGSSEMIL